MQGVAAHIDFSRAGRAAEMAHRATAAGLDVFHLSAGNLFNRSGIEQILYFILKQIAAVKLWYADKLAARKNISRGSYGKEAAPAAAG